MTDTELISGVCSHFDKFDPEFIARVRAAINPAVARFCTHTQWEFLDRFRDDLTTEISTEAAVGKYRIVLPDDFFKPVTFFTDQQEMVYISRPEWAARQAASQVSLNPGTYTVIGKEVILTYPPSGAAIQAVYTRDSSGITLSDLPGQYHPSVQFAIQSAIAPAKMTQYEETLYSAQVGLAFQMETQNKGRTKPIIPNALNIRRNAYP